MVKNKKCDFEIIQNDKWLDSKKFLKTAFYFDFTICISTFGRDTSCKHFKQCNLFIVNFLVKIFRFSRVKLPGFPNKKYSL